MIEHKGECIGCGRVVWRGVPSKELALSCACGALAPVISWSDGSTSWPSSISYIHLRGGKIPHLEYYLGFTDHQSPEKVYAIVLLASLGSTSYRQCKDNGCRDKAELLRERVFRNLKDSGRDRRDDGKESDESGEQLS